MVDQNTFILFFIFYLIVIVNTLIQDNESSDYPNHSLEHNNNIRKHFLNKRRQNLVNGKRMELLDKYLSNSSVFIDGIAHQIIDKHHAEWKEVNDIENEYKNLIQMKGMDYTYKRDMYWRTWRKVQYPNGEDVIVCYRCSNSINSTNCQYGGYWVIEDKPPRCSYEILSVINDRELCATSLTNTTNIEEKCPSVEQFVQLTAMCDNPIETSFRIMRLYNVSERNLFPSVICNGRDYCEISTAYMISRNYVTFRIINATNHIIYSRVMKNGGKNYACVKCGKIDPETKSVIVSEKPMSLDLLKKSKRNDNLRHFGFPKKTQPDMTDLPPENGKPDDLTSEGDFIFIEPMKNFHKNHLHKHSATCQSLKHFVSEDGNYDNSSDE